MDKVVSDILKAVKKPREVDLITKLGKDYIVTLSENGEPLMDGVFIYKNGKIEGWDEMRDRLKDYLKASANPIYLRKGAK